MPFPVRRTFALAAALSLLSTFLPLATLNAASKAPKNGFAIDASTDEVYFINAKDKKRYKVADDTNNAYASLLAMSTPMPGDDFFRINFSGKMLGPDSDKDGLSDSMETETLYGFILDAGNPDTDGDSYNDATELRYGYNPNSTGAPGFDELFERSTATYKKYRGNLISTSDNALWYVHPTNKTKLFVGLNDDQVFFFLENYAKLVDASALATIPSGNLASTYCGAYGIALNDEGAMFAPSTTIDCVQERIAACDTSSFIAVFPVFYVEYLYELRRSSSGSCDVTVTAFNKIEGLISKGNSMVCPVQPTWNHEDVFTYIYPKLEEATAKTLIEGSLMPASACDGDLADEFIAWGEQV